MTAPRRIAVPLPGNSHKRHALRVARGLPSPLIPAGPVQDHLAKLVGWGLTSKSIADAANVSRVMVDNHIHRLQPTIFRHYAAALLTVSYMPHPAQEFVLAVGSRRRVQALAANGHPLGSIVEPVGVYNIHNLRTMVEKATLRAEYQRAIFALYEQLEHVPGPSKRARTWAGKNGWVGPMAWEPETIDDPDAGPLEYQRSTETVVDLADVAELAEQGLDEAGICARLNCTPDDILRARRVEWNRRASETRAKYPPEVLADIRSRPADQSSEQIARELGMPRSTVSNIRAGRIRPTG
ncbi:helix-turn-helix domain-containing protein [Pseudonocardia sp. T1-2H]|uniref:helix-turn-helix domain-containing protein n=1 Tax=Pseudonocardia sp. T1-2H TaxID=3128899 RepID=UPI0031010E15